jgi:transcriptional regulator with XRE-family HTH domain
MLDLPSIGAAVAQRRQERQMRQIDLAEKAGVSRATVDALENGRLGELGFGKVARILSVLGLDLALGEANRRRPTLEDLIQEDARDQSLGRRR